MATYAQIIDFLLAGLESEAGHPLSGGKVYSYNAGLITAKDTYTVRDKSVVSTNPIPLDTYGRAVVYGDGLYKFVIKDASDVTIKTVDNYNSHSGQSITDYTAYTAPTYDDLLWAVDDPAGVPLDKKVSIANLVKAMGWYDVRSYASINAAITAIGATVTTLVVPDAQTQTANLVIPSTLTLKIFKGGSIVKAGAFTVTINGPFEAGLYQVFSGFDAGDVTFGAGSVEKVYVEWWGGKGDNATANVTPINSSIATGNTIQLLDGTYLTTGAHVMEIAAGQEFSGEGEEQTTIKKSTGVSGLLTLQGVQYQKVRNLTFDSNSLAGTALLVKGSYHSLENLRFENCPGMPLNFSGTNSSTAEKVTILSCGYGLNIDGDSNVNINCEDFVMDGGSATVQLFRTTNLTHGTFTNFAFDDAPAGFGFILFREYNYDVHFIGGYLEVGSDLNAASVIKIAETGNNNISFKNQLWSNAAANPAYSFLENVTGENVVLDTIWLRNSGTFEQIIKLGTVKFTSVKEVYLLDDRVADFIFIKDASTTRWTSVENCFYSTDYGAGVPYNSWNGLYITVKNSNMKQVVEATAGFLTFENVSGEIDLTNAAATATITLINCSGTITNPTLVGQRIIGSQRHPRATVASATELVLGTAHDIYSVSGTTNITSIRAADSLDGRIITLVFDGILTFTDGGNLVLAGNFVTSSGDTITLACLGTDWYEMSRSVN